MLSNATAVADEFLEQEPDDANVIPLKDFIGDYGDGLLDAVSESNPPIYDGVPNPERTKVLEGLLRRPFDAQQDVIQAGTRGLLDAGLRAVIYNCEQGTGKTLMAAATAAVMHNEGYERFLIICPPHLVYKWVRELRITVPNATVWVLNGPDTIRKLIRIRELNDQVGDKKGPVFFVMGRVRMRLGFHWRPAVIGRKKHVRHQVEKGNPDSKTFVKSEEYASCPSCGEFVVNEGELQSVPAFTINAADNRRKCSHCSSPLWTLMRPGELKNKTQVVHDALCQLPTIGPKTADRLIHQFGEDLLLGSLSDNIYELVNLLDVTGKPVFSNRQAERMERALAKAEYGFGQGGYQPTEYIKRYLPDRYFDALVIDEGHEYKGASTASGQAMGVLAGKVDKVLLLTGTLSGGYASDTFHLLWRIMPEIYMEDGFCYNSRNTLSTAEQAFMRQHGVLQEILKETDEGNHRTARGKKMSVRVKKAPGFGPQGIARYLLPYTVFLKLKDLGQVLPPYQEHFETVYSDTEQADKYAYLEKTLSDKLKEALRQGDTTLMGVVLNVLLRWPDTGFKPETVKHPRTRDLLAFSKSVFGPDDVAPKEEKLLDICRSAKARNRRVLVFTTYTGKHDTSARLKNILSKEGFKTAVLRSSVDTSRREDWIADQVDRGVEVLICNPDLVRTGLDLLDFPTIVFMQTGYNVYTLQQAARRSWRIGQTLPVDVHFLGYDKTMQINCLTLMAKKINVAQSTQGDIPESGLDVLNTDEGAVEVELARKLVA